ncbi:group II intron maturase-specific domain-containing protein [Paraburkholderia sediminicola]|uniref:Group II intron maturase-specific domain-containing protein n=1 Tax=Paraburkholderia rhynchosiae TaxID=487049 RepID=A0ACC7NMV5_9BURK
MKPSKANVKAHLDKIREVIKADKTTKQANLIRVLNPVLRGSANYHGHVVVKETTPIHRHIKIRANANPHDPEGEHYFESRWATKRQNS